MRNKHLATIGFAIWLAFCVVGTAYDTATLTERTATILAQE